MRRRFSLLARCGPKPSGGGTESILALLLNTKANAVEDAAEALKLRSEAVSLSRLNAADCAKYLAGQASDFGRLEDWENFDRSAQRARETFERLIRDERRHDFEGFFRNSGPESRSLRHRTRAMGGCVSIWMKLLQPLNRW